MTNFSTDTYTNIEQYAIRGLSQSTPLSQLYYSDLNRNALQEGMKNLVYARKKVVIGKQSDIELIQVMRSIYNKNANQYPQDLVKETKRLNVMVLDYCVNNIIKEIDIYNKYTYDITHIAQPINFGTSTSVRGNGELGIQYQDLI